MRMTGKEDEMVLTLDRRGTHESCMTRASCIRAQSDYY